MTTRYVAGFVFVEGRVRVMLIEKRKPAWQAGRLNAVGGKMENGESAQQAMSRECMEETGVEIPARMWQRFCVLRGNIGLPVTATAAEIRTMDIQEEDWEVHFFHVEVELAMLRQQMRTRTSEPVKLLWCHEVNCKTAIPNLPWLMLMAKNMGKDLHRTVKQYIITEEYDVTTQG